MIENNTIQKVNYQWLALGDSYTIGEGVDAAGRYPVQTAGMLNREAIHFESPKIIAVTGWTTGNLIQAVARPGAVSKRYDVVSLLIGVNNQYQGRTEAEYREEFDYLLKKSILLADNNPLHVVVLSIPDYSVTPFGERMAQPAQTASILERFNQINKKISDSLRVNYVDITEASKKAGQDPSLLAGDGLHYSAKEYAIWSALLVPVIKKIVRQSGS